MNEIKKKLNVLINQEDADFSDFTNASDHDYFNFLTKIEMSFAKHCNLSNAFELVVRDVTERQLEHPCSKNASDVYAYVITYYLQNQMRQFAKIKMADKEGQS